MLSYETAAKLKEAGFPQHEFAEGETRTCFRSVISNPNNDDEQVYNPSLSELIEACPKENELNIDFSSLYFILKLISDGNIGHKKKLSWTAGYMSSGWDEDFYDFDIGGHSSPEEAVANLWLKLNSKEE